MLCGAKTRNGMTCKNRAMPNGRCRMHGGKSPKGIAHPNFKDGRYSRYMPKGLKPAFERVLADPELLALNQDIATVESLIDESLHNLEGDNPRMIMGSIRQLWKSLWPAIQMEEFETIVKLRAKLDELIEEGAAQAEAFARLLNLTEQKRRLTESESRRREKMQEYLRAEDAITSYKALALAVKNNVKDRDVLSAIADEFARIAGLAAIPGPPSRSS